MKAKGIFLFDGTYEVIAVLMNPTAIWKRAKLMAMGFKKVGIAIGATDMEAAEDAENKLDHLYGVKWMSYDEIINKYQK